MEFTLLRKIFCMITWQNIIIQWLVSYQKLQRVLSDHCVGSHEFQHLLTMGPEKLMVWHWPQCSYATVQQRCFSNSSWIVLLCNRLNIIVEDTLWILHFQTIIDTTRVSGTITLMQNAWVHLTTLLFAKKLAN